MKVLHVCLGCFYIDNYSYQENLLPKYHARIGYDVEIIASTLSFNGEGKSCLVEPSSYINENNIPVTRLPYNKFFPQFVSRFFRLYNNLSSSLNQSNPDIIFIHGCQFLDILKVVRFIKRRSIKKVFVDNHADFSNSASNWLSRVFLHGVLWRFCAKAIQPYTTRFWGVLPARVDFLRYIYHIPFSKIGLLVMGADDDLVERYRTESNKINICSLYNIGQNKLLLITGGKIDLAKRQILTFLKLMKSYPDIEVLVYGSVIGEFKEEFDDICKTPNIHYVGWLNNEEIYQHIAACDLAVYPGRHSVLWEITAGLGVPMIVKYWEGTTHVDLGGNVSFLHSDDKVCLKQTLDSILVEGALSKMKEIAQHGSGYFSYLNIAHRSLEV